MSTLDFSTFLVVNDFTALAMSLRYLGEDQRYQVGGGEAQSNSVIGVLGPGTGPGRLRPDPDCGPLGDPGVGRRPCQFRAQ